MRGEVQKIYNRSVKGIIFFAIIVFLIPILIPSTYVTSTLIMIGLYTLICTGLTMLMGYAGQISLGHAAFYGIGAYASSFITVKLGYPGIVGILVGTLFAVLIAYIVGIPTLKLTGHYLALATLGFGVIVFILFKQLKSVTGGLEGVSGIPSLNLFGYEFDTDFKYYYLIWILALLGILLARNVIQSRVGRALRSIHGSEIASDAIGVDIRKYKLQVFIMSAMYASIAGSIYAHYISFINPMLFDPTTSINFLIMSVVGGSGTIWGGLVGSLLFVLLGEVLKEVMPLLFTQASDQVQIVFFGILLVILLIYMPQGLAPGFEKLWNGMIRRMRGRDNDSYKKTVTEGDQREKKEIPAQAAGGGQ
ncbi:branched-chain amino acid ABC transporter permease [Collibacillus ludicampi]|uniref:Branched-chain amino acid ABC transporter permease n=1 Tax=Collibacillus ludicampi TaxID=2771369 RepID=A0AAV4LHC9_9BACL|nr:branched-chain amino acid ABC transporter permease [Collibacillus ludicampi]GIM46914.1 branched-chain amino acid ABC transporter permease [Collibacillus ludicampi]